MSECKHVWEKPLEGYNICVKCGETRISLSRRWEVKLIRRAPIGSGIETESDRPFDDFYGDFPLEFSRWVKYLEESKAKDLEKKKLKEKQAPAIKKEKQSALQWLHSQISIKSEDKKT
jgi:hypothetical protein